MPTTTASSMKIPESTFKRLPEHLKALFKKLPNPGSEEVARLFPESSTTGKRSAASRAATVKGTAWLADNHQSTEYTDSAARFFYCAKASKKDRDEGLSNPATPFVQFQATNGTSGRPSSLSEGRNTKYRNHHPTVKPTDLMRYLCRLVTPPGGTVLDPFTGSGSTGKAAKLEGFSFIGIEREAEYAEIARNRINAVRADAATAGISANNPAPTLFDCP